MLEPIPFMEEIRADVFAYVQPPGGWWLSNAGLVAGSDTVTIIDTAATAVQTRQLLAAVREVLTDRRPPRQRSRH